MKNFYTASEAQKRLNMDKNGFYYLVRKGTIKGITMPGKKQSVYPRTDVDRLAASIKTLVEQYDRETSTFYPATKEDLPEEYAMDVSLYGKDTAPIETRIAKLERNPESDFVLKNAGEVVGHISFHPVKEDILKKFLEGETTRILPEHIIPYTPDKPLEILVVVMSVKPGFPNDVARHYGLRLIAGAVHFFKLLGERGIEINNVYATSRTPTGIRICRKLGMEQQPVPTEQGRYSFSINAQTSDSILAKEYQESLAEYKRNHLVTKKVTRRSDSKNDSKDSEQPPTKAYNNGQNRKGNEHNEELEIDR